MKGVLMQQRHHYIAIPCLLVGTVAFHRPHQPAHVLRGWERWRRAAAEQRAFEDHKRSRQRVRAARAAAAVALAACLCWGRVRTARREAQTARPEARSARRGGQPRVQRSRSKLPACPPDADAALAAERAPCQVPSKLATLGMSEVMRFVWPIVLASFASTMMGLVDSCFVGRCAGYLHLAALAPATSLLEGLSYVLSFVSIGTLNVVAAVGPDPSRDELERLLSRSLSVAVAVGLTAAVAVSFGASTLVRICGAKESLVPLAVSYATVRAWGLPFELVYRVANAGLLAARDSRTGLVVVVVQSLINGLGDIVICPMFGITGAAMTTVTAQILGCLTLLGLLRRRQILMHFEAPELGDALAFLGFALPVCLTLALKVSVVQMLNATASHSGVINGAAHQIAKSVFWVFSLMASESLSCTAQALLPGAFKEGDRQGAARILRLLLLLATVGAVVTTGILGMGVAMGGFALFSTEEKVLARVPVMPLCIAVFATPYAFCLEGAHIAAQRQRWLSQRLLTLTMFTAAVFIWGPRGDCALRSLWGAFAAYVVGRAAWYAWGVWGLRGVLATPR
mmetsp:Transcript_141578/g.394624  ORF Transcript_141578/g.394624 Transcript_141578/m.394624 type:complete len:569 (+) Transcript_141578:65-1771(+)